MSISAIESNVFSGKELVKAVELMISKKDLRDQPELCKQMLQYFGFSASDIRETLNDGKYIDFTPKGALGLVRVN